jgi:hypothetical protein
MTIIWIVSAVLLFGVQLVIAERLRQVVNNQRLILENDKKLIEAASRDTEESLDGR